MRTLRAFLGRLRGVAAPRRSRFVLVMAILAVPGWAKDSLLAPGTLAPDPGLATLDGDSFELAELRGRTVALLFGDLNNRNSLSAARDIAKITADPGLVERGVAAFFLTAEGRPPDELATRAREENLSIPVVHDPQRKAFAAYRVRVLPSLVVIDASGHVVASRAGRALDFADIASDAVLLAEDLIRADEYAARRGTKRAAVESKARIRAKRLVAMAEQLTKKGRDEAALRALRDASEADPLYEDARLWLGRCLLDRSKLDEADEQFQAVLRISPDSIDAALGALRVRAGREGSDAESVRAALGELVHRHPDEPRVFYVAGRIAEKDGDLADAVRYYRRAAELHLSWTRPADAPPFAPVERDR